jgi:hypothetical protein
MCKINEENDINTYHFDCENISGYLLSINFVGGRDWDFCFASCVLGTGV